MNSTILSLVTLFILVLGVFVVAAENQTTNESVGNKSKSANNTSVQPLSLWVSVNVEPSVLNLGTVPPDGIERSYPEVATVTVIYFLAFNDRLSVRASGDLVNADGSTIPLSNLKFSTPNVPKRSFTTSDYTILTYSGLRGSRTVPISFYITVPFYSDPGTYSVTIIYTAT
ncbi:hypothetical protein MTTB_10860 [Methanothermobacter tenebrarum]|jgi:hypothetical protein|uniref:Uncharacterized protein n=1 Tax=Methanothermobacter tenebrarum TaxID=680118 RepID=A0ABN6PBT2_9EURY|nr:hypothetical protein [Methanothermobacter tenebrarum]MDX9692969.1 hypothetical protein [Methanothermobacter sp.]BDH79707.1 hypothetical protein MTTB_10860 [Methanothermobacter tenebrarum]HOQ20139.1 hypothetical protein [Methanothermobacter sp.]